MVVFINQLQMVMRRYGPGTDRHCDQPQTHTGRLAGGKQSCTTVPRTGWPHSGGRTQLLMRLVTTQYQHQQQPKHSHHHHIGSDGDKTLCAASRQTDLPDAVITVCETDYMHVIYIHLIITTVTSSTTIVIINTKYETYMSTNYNTG